MPAGPVILNNTPLVALWPLDHLHLLRDLFGEVWISQSVFEEFLAVNREERTASLQNATWIKPITLSNPRQALPYVGLDQGEADVLALAVEQSARLVVIDERKGRRYARRLELPLTGTLGLLLLAKEKGLISSLAPLIQQLQSAGLHFSIELVAKVIELAGE
ncbi:MAG: DUF3368 domain-containing protein [Ardenticatenaceae bacterium]|nr:DUF3368 domain-containing protein [Ardenticatenaceae bacterium]